MSAVGESHQRQGHRPAEAAIENRAVGNSIAAVPGDGEGSSTGKGTTHFQRSTDKSPGGEGYPPEVCSCDQAAAVQAIYRNQCGAAEGESGVASSEGSSIVGEVDATVCQGGDRKTQGQDREQNKLPGVHRVPRLRTRDVPGSDHRTLTASLRSDGPCVHTVHSLRGH